MTFPYHGALDIPVFYIGAGAGAFMILGDADRSGGPVVFTSRTRLYAFLRHHADRWGALAGAEARRLPCSLGTYVQHLRQDLAAHPQEVCLHIDARPSLLPHEDFDSDTLPLL